jgi:hypothetical protein
MLWFDRLFPVFMLSFPAAFVLGVRAHARFALDTTPRLRRRVFRATAIGLVVHLAVQLALEVMQAERTGLRAAWTVLCATGGSLWLWFGFALPALAAAHPGWRSPHGMPEPASDATRGGSPGAVRVASLAPRDRGGEIPASVWWTCWIIVAACSVAIAWAVGQGVSSVLLLGLGFWFGMAVFGTRKAPLEAEPRDAGGSPELAAAYASLRRFKVWCWLWMGLIGTLTFAVVGVVAAIEPRSAGWLGAVLGTSFGVAGGVFGVVASIRRARIHARLAELEADAHVSADGTVLHSS